jgi:DNA integrity scanning protein DisA with diadenylate cyclase activity
MFALVRGVGQMFESILCQVTECNADVLESLLELAVEIAREGREGRRVGTLFTLGDEDAVLARSRPLILDPLLGDLNLRATPPIRTFAEPSKNWPSWMVASS